MAHKTSSPKSVKNHKKRTKPDDGHLNQTHKSKRSKRTKPDQGYIRIDSGIDLNNISMSNLLDKCKGLLIGAGIGDSIGSFLEFKKGIPVLSDVNLAMKMPGGATFRNPENQVDKSQMIQN